MSAAKRLSYRVGRVKVEVPSVDSDNLDDQGEPGSNGNPSITSKIRRHQNRPLTPAMKQELCQYRVDHPDASFRHIAAVFNVKWTIPLTKYSVRYVLRASDKWLPGSSKLLPSSNNDESDNKHEVSMEIGESPADVKSETKTIRPADECLIVASEITDDMKRDVCVYKKSCPSATLKDVAAYFSDKWCMQISMYNMRYILRNSDKWLGPHGDNQQLSKLSRPALSSEMKKEICVYRMCYPDTSMAAIAVHFNIKWAFPMNADTVKRVLWKKDQWLNFQDPEESVYPDLVALDPGDPDDPECADMDVLDDDDDDMREDSRADITHTDDPLGLDNTPSVWPQPGRHTEQSVVTVKQAVCVEEAHECMMKVVSYIEEQGVCTEHRPTLLLVLQCLDELRKQYPSDNIINVPQTGTTDGIIDGVEASIKCEMGGGLDVIGLSQAGDGASDVADDGDDGHDHDDFLDLFSPEEESADVPPDAQPSSSILPESKQTQALQTRLRDSKPTRHQLTSGTNQNATITSPGDDSPGKLQSCLEWRKPEGDHTGQEGNPGGSGVFSTAHLSKGLLLGPYQGDSKEPWKLQRDSPPVTVSQWMECVHYADTQTQSSTYGGYTQSADNMTDSLTSLNMEVVHVQKSLYYRLARDVPSDTQLVLYVSQLNRIPKEPPSYVCTTCGRQLASANQLMFHLRTHTGERPHHCVICDQRFTRPSTLSVHIRTHTNYRPHQCSQCGKTFTQASHLRKHVRTHTGEKPYQCGICGLRYSQQCQVKRHSRIHTRERPFHCDMCDKSFSDSSTLRKHRKRHITKGDVPPP